MVKIAGYPIDCALNERLNYEAEATKFPVEKGADVSDHVRAQFPVFELDGLVSDTPIGALVSDPSRQTEAGKALPSRDSFDFLVGVYNAKQPVTVECSFGKFDNMVLVNLTPEKNKETTKAFKFTATFSQLEIKENNRTTIRTAVPNASGKLNFGALQALLKGLTITFVTSSKADPVIRKEKLRQGYRLVATTTHDQRVTSSKRQNQSPDSPGFDPFAAFGTPGKVDHYFADQTETSDGYITGKADYFPYVSHVSKVTLQGKSVRWDYRTSSWVDDDSNQIVERPPKGKDRWKNVTFTRVPGPLQ